MDIASFPQSSDIEKKSDEDISDFQISGQSLKKEKYNNSRTSYDIDMKLAPVTKVEKKNKKLSNKLTMTSRQQIVTLLSFS